MTPHKASEGAAPAPQLGTDLRKVELIHEALLRSPPAADDAEPQPYWGHLVEAVKANQDADTHRQQLRRNTQKWLEAGRPGWWGIPGWRNLADYQPLRLQASRDELAYLRTAHRPHWLNRVTVWGVVTVALGLGVHYPIRSEMSGWLGSDAGIDAVMRVRWLWGGPPIPVTKPLPELPAAFEYGCLSGHHDPKKPDSCNDGEDSQPHYKLTPAHLPQPPCTEMGQFTVTQAEYDYYLWQQRRQAQASGTPPSQLPSYPKQGPQGKLTGWDWNWRQQDLPVVNLNYSAVQAYLRWLNQQPGQRGWRLPTEQEWEYAARAPGQESSKSGRYWWGDEDPKTHRLANCRGCEGGVDGLAPVGSYGANAYGLYDMAGNVWQWTQPVDTQDNQPFRGSPEEGEKAVNGVVGRVLRGGSWLIFPALLRVAVRFHLHPVNWLYSFGFRVCRASPI